jgi:hypothetical protein
MRTGLVKLSAIVAVLAITASASAAVYNKSTYAGASCVPWTGTKSLWWSGIVNNQGSLLGVDCPIVRDETDIHRPSSGWVKVRDRSNSSSVSCDMRTGYTSGSDIVTYGGTAATTTTETYWQVKGVNAPGSTGDEYSWYFFSCSIPAVDLDSSGLASYGIEEIVSL